MSYLKKFKNRKKASSLRKSPNINAIERPPISTGDDIWPKIIRREQNQRVSRSDEESIKDHIINN
jgi:hypothetical protein